MADNTLINHLPNGDAHYERGDGDGWYVTIFAHGGTQRLMTVAKNVDKSVALWIAGKLNESLRNRERDRAMPGTLTQQLYELSERCGEAIEHKVPYPNLRSTQAILVDAATSIEDNDLGFQLRWDADKRAIEAWHEANPDRTNIWPDHADLVVWLMDRYVAMDEQISALSAPRSQK